MVLSYQHTGFELYAFLKRGIKATKNDGSCPLTVHPVRIKWSLKRGYNSHIEKMSNGSYQSSKPIASIIKVLTIIL